MINEEGENTKCCIEQSQMRVTYHDLYLKSTF